MRHQIFGMCGVRDPKALMKRHQITVAEIAAITELTAHAPALLWEEWHRADVDGFRAVLPNGYRITIRKHHNCIYGSTNRRWSRYGIDGGSTDHWYHVLLEDIMGKCGRKQVIDYAAPPADTGYACLHALYASAEQSSKRDGACDLLDLSSLPVLAMNCVAMHPLGIRTPLD